MLTRGLGPSVRHHFASTAGPKKRSAGRRLVGRRAPPARWPLARHLLRRSAPPPCRPGAARRARPVRPGGRGGSLRADRIVRVSFPLMGGSYPKPTGSNPHPCARRRRMCATAHLTFYAELRPTAFLRGSLPRKIATWHTRNPPFGGCAPRRPLPSSTRISNTKKSDLGSVLR